MPQPIEMQIDVPATENHPLEAQIPGKLVCQSLKNATARGGDALRHNEMPDLTYETRHGSHFRAVSASDVFPVRGSGVFVREDREGDYLSIGTTRGISAEYPHRKVTSVVQELSLLQADSVLAKRMHCAEGDQVWRVVRLRQVDGNPLAYETAWYLKEFVPFINEQIAEGSLFGYARNDLGLNFGFVDKVLYAGKLEADAARVLGLNEGDPALYLEDDSFLTNGRLFNSSFIAYHYVNARFFTMTSMR